jgi:tetratricopeptide (TPR) repeat protein
MNSKQKRNGILAIIILLLVLVIGFLLMKGNGTDKYIESLAKTGINGEIEVIYPIGGSVFPLDIASPTFQWRDKSDNSAQWLVLIESGGKIEYVSDFLQEPIWKADSSDWENIKEFSAGKNITVNVIGVRKDKPAKIYSGGKVNIAISKDSVAAPIFYRAVPLPFSFAVKNLGTISWRLGNVSSYSPSKILLTNLPVCGNCHSFSADGQTIGMDVDYANDKGSYFISPLTKKTDITVNKIMTWHDYKREDGEFTFGLLSQVSPDGRYALSTVKDRSIFVKIENLDYSQLFFPIKGIIAVYDIKNKKFWALPGADNKELCQSNPMWSPDGKTVLFACAPVYHNAEAEKSKDAILPTNFAAEFIEGRRDFKFDIYQLPFNEGRGGVAVPLPGASANGMSNFFPKYSPDGKWIVFTQAKNFMLLQPDSKLYIMPSGGGTPRLMKCNNIGTMNSWHSWSPNGKWLVFSSKTKGAYTRLYLTHIDENGNDSPAILLENMNVRNRAANIPEFVNTKFDNIDKIVEKFIANDNYAVARGQEKMRLGDKAGALKELDKAIKLNPKDDISYNQRGIINTELGRHKEALEDFTKVIQLKPESFTAYHNRANVKIQMKDFAGAIEDINKALKLNPKSSREYFSRAEAKFGMNDFKGAIADLNTNIRFDEKNVKAYNMRGTAKYNIEDYKGAIEDFSQTIKINPKDSLTYFRRALSKMQIGQMESALKDLKDSRDKGYKEADDYINKFFNGK